MKSIKVTIDIPPAVRFRFPCVTLMMICALIPVKAYRSVFTPIRFLEGDANRKETSSEF